MRMRTGVAYHPSVPRHLQVQRVLRGRIESGEWGSDHPIPTEMELLAEFGVSRTTIREALGVLTRDGLIARHRRRGSFVQIKVVRMETTAAPGHIAGALGVERGTPLTRLVRLEIVDGAPLAVAVNYMSTALGRRIRPRDLTRMSLLEFLRDRLRMPLGAIHQSIEARLPDLETAGLLDTDLTQPVLAVRLVVTDAAGRAVEVSDTFYRADRYRYEVETRLPPPGRRPDARDARPRRARTVRQP